MKRSRKFLLASPTGNAVARFYTWSLTAAAATRASAFSKGSHSFTWEATDS